jgi:3-oxoacyl-[acyl-carrier-protein] synthase-3
LPQKALESKNKDKCMPNAAITGWGKYLPPNVLSNKDIATFLDTSDEWITTRTGIKERRVSHVSLTDMTEIAAKRALACAGIEGKDLDLIVMGTTSHDEQCPNQSSGLQQRIPGAEGCGAMDVNTACTSFLYGLSTASAMIKSGVIKTALVMGGERISPFMNWNDRNVAVLFGDGVAGVVLQATDKDEGLQVERLGCYGESRAILQIHGMGCNYAHTDRLVGKTEWQFEGQEIFKKAVGGMSLASDDVLKRAGMTAADVDICVPHQANLRIIEAVAKKAGVPMDRVYVSVERYGNMSAATVPVALCEALEDGRVKPGANVLMPAFGGGLTFCAHLVRWGERVTPIGKSDADAPPPQYSALELVNRYRKADGHAIT